jgi:hypothetical protein
MLRSRAPVIRIASALLPAMLAATAPAGELSGPLSGYLPADTYTIVGDIYVPAGLTLTLAPGVIFEFDDDF